MWMLFHAVHKETKEAVCVHILHKEKIPKAQRDSEPFLELMRREANQLVRVRMETARFHFDSAFHSALFHSALQIRKHHSVLIQNSRCWLRMRYRGSLHIA
jgi:hypothetical protein